MAILGPCDDLETFLKNLDEHKLVDLCADLLTIRGHSDITITDGPGDGQRDIHSKDEKGVKYLTQSKFHKNSSKTVSAKELGETVLGMVRFGYRQGVFITNAKISPQAKRDALNDYPGYNIEFLDGRRLIEEVFQSLILKAIWYDGVALDTVQYSVVFPMVARDLELDKPLSLSWLGQEQFQGNSLATGRTRAQIRFVSSTGNVSVFGNRYRTPRRRTFYEHGSPRLEIIETILTGEIHLEDIEIIIHTLQEIVTKKVIENQPSKKHIALIVGFPSLTPFGGEATGARIELSNHRPTTIVCHEGIVHNEWEWLLPKEDGLLVPQRLRASETSLFCYYIPKHDICFDMILVTAPSDEVRWQMEERYYWLVRSWHDSLFMRIPDALYDSWDENDLTQPSRWLRWENEWLGLWYHPKFQAPFFECLVEGDDEESGWFFPDSAEIQKECAKIRKSIEKLGGKFVEPDIARHMVATVDIDPYIRTDIVEYPLVQLLLWPESIPSPIELDSRSIIIKVWWKVFDREKKRAILEPEANCIVERLEEESNLRFHVKSWIANCSSSGELFINAEIQSLSKMGYKTTTDFYNDIESTVEEFILHLESIISTYCGFWRCSRHFWEKELLIPFA